MEIGKKEDCLNILVSKNECFDYKGEPRPEIDNVLKFIEENGYKYVIEIREALSKSIQNNTKG